MSSSSARAWPHFVPRLELDAELKPIHGQLKEICKRLDITDSSAADFGAESKKMSRSLQDKTSAQLAASEERVSHELASVRLELQRGLESVRACTAAEAKVRESMQEAYQRALEALGVDLAAVDRETKRIEAVFNEIPSIYATKNELQALRDRLQNDMSVDRGELRAELGRLENDKVDRKEMHALTNAVSLKVQSVENTVTMQALCVEGLKKDYKVLENRLVEEAVTTTTFHGLAATVSELGQQLRTAGDEKASMRKKLEYDYEVLRRNVFSYRDSVRDIQGAIEQGYTLSSDIAALQKRCGKHDEELAALRGLEKEHWEASSEALDEQRRDHMSLQTWCRALQQELYRHVENTMEQTDHVRRHSTKLSLEQMDKAMGLHRSLAELEKTHQDLQHSVRSIQLPRL